MIYKLNDECIASLKKQSGTFTEISGNYGFSYDKRNRAFMPTDGSIISFHQILPIYADKSFIIKYICMQVYKSISEKMLLEQQKLYFCY